MKRAVPGIIAILFLLVAVYFTLIVFNWSPTVSFLVAFPGALIVMGIFSWLIDKYEDSVFVNSKWFIVVTVLVCILILTPVVWDSYLELRAGYYEGDYSDTDCSFCGMPADGGAFYSGKEIMNCYCKEHFIKVQISVQNMSDATDSDIWMEVKEIVEGRLKAPSTAEFCSKSEANIREDGNTWTVSGYVDAENSFGAMIRNDFTVVITFTNDSQYLIEKCNITAR